MGGVGMAMPDPHGLPALVGIGVTFKRDKLNGCYVVRRVIESGPAALNGEVQPGDEFHEVDGIPVAAKAPEELTNMVLGPAGSRVDLTIIRHGERITVTIRRAEINYEHSLQANELHKIRMKQDRRAGERGRGGRSGDEVALSVPTGNNRPDPAAAAAAASEAIRALARMEETTTKHGLAYKSSEQPSTEMRQRDKSQMASVQRWRQEANEDDARVGGIQGGGDSGIVAKMIRDRENETAKVGNGSREFSQMSGRLPQNGKARALDADGAIEQVAARALQTKTPPRMSHKQLLELAGVIGGGEGAPEDATIECTSGTGARTCLESSPPPQPHQGHPQSQLQRPAQDQARQRQLQKMDEEQQQRSRDKARGNSARHDRSPGPSQSLPTDHPSHAGVTVPERHVSNGTRDDGQAVSGGLARVPLPPPAHGRPRLPGGSQATAAAEPNMLNLELYRAVAAANTKPAHEPLVPQDSWNSVDSDHQLAMRLQTEEVMQHSMSQEWGSESLASQSQHSLHSQHSSRSLASVNSELSTHSGASATYYDGDDVDDETLRRLLPQSMDSQRLPDRQRAPVSGVQGLAGRVGAGGRNGGAQTHPVPHQSPYKGRVNSASTAGIPPPQNRHHPQYTVPAVPANRSEPERGVLPAVYDSPHNAQPSQIQSDAGGESRAEGAHGRSGGNDCLRVWVMRHGARLDEEEPGWKDTADRPYDPPITRHGRDQARQAALMLRNLSSREGVIDCIVASPFLRCLQTAAEVAAILGIDRIGIDHGLCEVLQKRNVPMRPAYLTLDQLAAQDPSLARWNFTPNTQKSPQWPEELAEARERFNQSFTRIPLRTGCNILLVAHGDTVAQFVAYTRGVREDCVYSVPPCSAAGAELEVTQGPTSGEVSFQWQKCRLMGEILVLDDLFDVDSD